MSALRNFFFGATINARSTDFGLLLLRMMVGLALALAHGRGKFPPSERFIQGAAKMGFPLPELFAWAAASGEFLGGLFLAIGLMTRPSAFLILATMGTAFFLVHGSDPFGDKEKAFLYGAAALLFLFSGAGRYSLDALINRGRTRRPR